MAEEFTIAPIRRLLKKAGDLKVSNEAVFALREYVGLYGVNIAEQAVKVAKQDNRKMVLESDIRKAAEKIWIPESEEAE
jgi:histone H3/H4